MGFTHLLALLIAWPANGASLLDADCRAAQIPHNQCERYIWAQGRQTDLEDKLLSLERVLHAAESQDRRYLIDQLASAAAAGGEIWRATQLVSGAIDGIGSPQLRGSLELRAKTNELNERLADARDRLLGLQRLVQVAVGGPAFESAPWLAAPHLFIAGLPVDQAAKSARPQPDMISRALESKKSSYSQRKAYRSSAKAFSNEKESAERLLMAHAAGDTETIGDPHRRAGLLHRQDGQTCAVVAAQQLLLEHGLLDIDGDLSKQEDALFEESVSAGYFRGRRSSGGTPWQFIGNLAQDRGLIIVKHVRAAEEDLDDVVALGKMVIADVDSSMFWHNRDFYNATHTIVVTGLEREKRTGKVLGYYVNDSDSGVYYSAGRLIPVETFIAAWKARASRFIEVR